MKVRLKPYNPRIGCVRKSVSPPWGGTIFKHGVWYNVTDEAALAWLRTERQYPGNPRSQLAFDVVDETSARALIRAEEAEAQGKVQPVQPVRPEARPPTPKRVSVGIDHDLNLPSPTHELTATPDPSSVAPPAVSAAVQPAEPDEVPAAKPPSKRKPAAKTKRKASPRKRKG